jgi:hypothetical protein
VENLPASTLSHNWTVGKYLGGTASPGGGYTIRVQTMINLPDSPYADGGAFTISGGGAAVPSH